MGAATTVTARQVLCAFSQDDFQHFAPSHSFATNSTDTDPDAATTFSYSNTDRDSYQAKRHTDMKDGRKNIDATCHQRGQQQHRHESAVQTGVKQPELQQRLREELSYPPCMPAIRNVDDTRKVHQKYENAEQAAQHQSAEGPAESLCFEDLSLNSPLSRPGSTYDMYPLPRVPINHENPHTYHCTSILTQCNCHHQGSQCTGKDSTSTAEVSMQYRPLGNGSCVMLGGEMAMVTHSANQESSNPPISSLCNAASANPNTHNHFCFSGSGQDTIRQYSAVNLRSAHQASTLYSGGTDSHYLLSTRSISSSTSRGKIGKSPDLSHIESTDAISSVASPYKSGMTCSSRFSSAGAVLTSQPQLPQQRATGSASLSDLHVHRSEQCARGAITIPIQFYTFKKWYSVHADQLLNATNMEKSK